MYSVFNKYKNNKNYIHKSAITKSWLVKNNFPKSVTVKDVKSCFDNCSYKVDVVGVSFDKSKQKHIKYVNTRELYKSVVYGINRNK